MTQNFRDSLEFERISGEIAKLITENMRVGPGQIETMAGLIAAQLAHEHKLVPKDLKGMTDWTINDDGTSNSGHEFQAVVATIRDILYSQIDELFLDTQYVADLIMSEVVKKYKLRPA